MTHSHDTLVQHQFGPRAAAYVSSAVHASGEDLAAIGEIARRHAPAHALDLGTGAAMSPMRWRLMPGR
jgi:hypothetical protein